MYSSASETFDVNVNYPGGSVLVRVHPSWDVARVKQEIARETRNRVSTRDFKIVFAGEALEDHQRLLDIGLQGYSTLHCIRFAGGVRNLDMVTTEMGSIKLDRVASNLGAMPGNQDSYQANSTNRDKVKQRFFVYCKRPCKTMTPGKLRVRCADCKSSSFVLNQGPGGWDDVLQSRRMHGKCNNEECGRTEAEFFFKCAVHPTEDGEDSVALHMVRANTIGVECAICTGVPQDQVVVFGCQDGHSVCVSCFIDYCRHQLINRQFIQVDSRTGYTIRCPAGCAGSEITEIHHFRLMGMHQYAKYQKFATEECILQMGGLLCPNVNCGEGLLPEDGGRRIQCPPAPNGCGFTFCRDCLQSFHHGQCQRGAPMAEQGGQAYQVDPQNLERARWIEANERFIQTNTNIKPCPRCQVPIEKNGGCMHMTCGRANCKFEWCWMCGIEWNRQCQSNHWFGV